MDKIIIALLAVVLVIQLIILIKGKNKGEQEKVAEKLGELKKENQELRIGVIKEIYEGQIKNEKMIRESLVQIQQSNDRKLSEIQKNMDEIRENFIEKIKVSDKTNKKDYYTISIYFNRKVESDEYKVLIDQIYFTLFMLIQTLLIKMDFIIWQMLVLILSKLVSVEVLFV